MTTTTVFETLCRSEFFISGIRNKALGQYLASLKPASGLSPSQATPAPRIIKKVGKTYK